jgi:hypothetical protein
MQARVAKGAENQNTAAKHLEEVYGAEIVSIAAKGSNVTDVVIRVGKKQYNVEVKGTDNVRNPVSLFDISVSRKNYNFPVLNTIAKAMIRSNGKQIPKNYVDREFLYGIDLARGEVEGITIKQPVLDKKVGFPLDNGVTTRSGKTPSFYSSTASDAKSEAFNVLMSHFAEKEDVFFCIVNKDKVYTWYTGPNATSPLKGVKKLTLADLTSVAMLSYGVEYYRKDNPELGIKKGDLKGVLRAALKIKFNII